MLPDELLEQIFDDFELDAERADWLPLLRCSSE